MDNPSRHPSSSQGLKRPHQGVEANRHSFTLSAGQEAGPSAGGGMNPQIRPFTLPTQPPQPSGPSQPTLDLRQLAAQGELSDDQRAHVMAGIIKSIQQLNSVTGAPTNAAPFGMLADTADPELLRRLGDMRPEEEALNSTLPSEGTSTGTQEVSERPSYWRVTYTTAPPLSDLAWTLLQPGSIAPSVSAIVASLSSPLAPETSTSGSESVANQPSPPSRGRSASATFKVVPTPSPNSSQEQEQGTSSGTSQGKQAQGQEQPRQLPAVHAAFFRVVEVGEGLSNSTYQITLPFVLDAAKLAEYFPLPPEELSWEALLTRQQIDGDMFLEVLTIRRALGWEFILLSILNFRTFYLEMLIIPDHKFPISLPKDDVIDVGLVLIISGWISNLVALRILGNKIPTAASVAHFIETCLRSLEITVLICIACQADLSNRTVEEIEELTWYKLVKPIVLVHYTTRVVIPVKQRVLSWYFGFVSHVLSGTIRVMTNTRLSPDTAAHWFRKYLLASTALDGQLSGCRVHLFLKDPLLHPHIHDVDAHDMYTQHEGADICKKTISKCHEDIRAGRQPPRTSFMFRSGIETDAVSNAIDYFVETTPLALSLTHQKNRNPYIDYSKEGLHLLGLLPVVTALVTVAYSSLAHFGSETSPEKILGNQELQEAYDKQSRCVGVWIREALSKGTSVNNLEDLKFMNSFISQRLSQAIQSCEGTRQVWHSGRSDSVFYDPLICWTTTAMGPQQDFLSYYEAVGTTSDDILHGDDGEPQFRRSAVTDLYDEALKAHEKKMAAKQSTPNTEMLGAEAILRMSHLTPETTGEAWPLISVCLNRAQRNAAAETVELTNLLRGVSVPPPRTRRRLD